MPDQLQQIQHAIQIPFWQSTFHGHAQRNVSHHRDARLQSRSFGCVEVWYGTMADMGNSLRCGQMSDSRATTKPGFFTRKEVIDHAAKTLQRNRQYGIPTDLDGFEKGELESGKWTKACRAVRTLIDEVRRRRMAL